MSRHLLNHQIRITKTHDPFDTNFLGYFNAMDKCFILGNVVRSSKMNLQHIPQLIPLWRCENYPGAQTHSYLGPVKMHFLVIWIWQWWFVLHLHPFYKEICNV